MKCYQENTYYNNINIRFDHIRVATTLELYEKGPLFSKDESDRTWV